MEIFYFAGVFMGAVVLLIGIVSKKYPSKYGSNTGMNLPQARKSKENWDYAQKHGSLIFIKCGFIIIILSIILGICFVCIGILRDKFYIPLIIEFVLSWISIIVAMIKIEIDTINFAKHKSKFDYS